MKKSGWMILFSAALALYGCGTGDEAHNEIVSEVIDGVTHIRNPMKPLNPEKSVEFAQQLTISPEDEGGNVFYSMPAYFLVSGSGHMYIADAKDQQFKVFGPEGNFIRTVGSQGGGPGEFQRLGFGGIAPDGRLLAADFMARRTSLFDRSGEFIRDFKWTKNYSGVHLVKNDSFLVEEYVYGEDRPDHRLFLKELDFEGNEVRSYGEFTPREVKMVPMGNAAFGTPVPHAPFSIFAGDSKRGWLYHCLNNKYRIEVYDGEGNLFRVIDRPYKPLPFTAEEKQAYRDRYKDYPRPEMRKVVNSMEMPDVKTVTDKMIVDGSGNLWVFTHEKRETEGTELTAVDIFDPEGRYDSRVWLQIMPEVLKNGKMYRLVTDEETGYRSLVRYAVRWN